MSLKQQKDSTKIKKGFTLRESFDIEQIKTFREFLPRSNIGAITERHNKRVMTFVEKMEEERKSKMMESQKALVNSIVLLQSVSNESLIIVIVVQEDGNPGRGGG